MFNQSLQNYKHDFLLDSRWRSKESPHYKFWFFVGSLAEIEIEDIVQKQELSFHKILEFLKLPEPSRKIEYYLYSDAKTKRELMGNDWYAGVIYNEFRIHALYTSEIKPVGEHEDTHLLSLPWGLAIGFFQEGLAEHMVDHAWDGKNHIEYVIAGYQKNIFPPLENFFTHQTWLDTDDEGAIYFYSLAGGFSTFLINAFGRDLYKSLYTGLIRDFSQEQNKAVFEKVYNLPFGEIEKRFLAKTS